MYLNIFECIYSISMVHFNVSIIYFNAFIVCFNVFHYISMCLNVFIDIVIGILPSYSHCNVFIMHIHLHFFFFILHNDSLPNMLIYYIIFFHFHWSIPTFIQSLEKLHINPYFVYTSFHIAHSSLLRLYIVPHCTFHIPCHHWLHRA
jgi:hypothetical protein